MYRFALIGESLSHSYSPMIHSKFGDIVQWEIFDGETFNKNYKLLNEHIESIIYKGYKVIFPVSSKERGLE